MLKNLAAAALVVAAIGIAVAPHPSAAKRIAPKAKTVAVSDDVVTVFSPQLRQMAFMPKGDSATFTIPAAKSVDPDHYGFMEPRSKITIQALLNAGAQTAKTSCMKHSATIYGEAEIQMRNVDGNIVGTSGPLHPHKWTSYRWTFVTGRLDDPSIAIVLRRVHRTVTVLAPRNGRCVPVNVPMVAFGLMSPKVKISVKEAPMTNGVKAEEEALKQRVESL